MEINHFFKHVALFSYSIPWKRQITRDDVDCNFIKVHALHEEAIVNNNEWRLWH
jgi:hypothetical protein